jgi:hypothetical protein
MMKMVNHELPRELTSEELDIVAGGQGPVPPGPIPAAVLNAEDRIEEGLAMVQKDLGMVQHEEQARIDFLASFIATGRA